MTLKGKGVPGLAWKSAAFSGKLPDVLMIDVTIEDEAGELFWATSQPCAMSEEHDGADWMERRDGERSLIGSIGDAVRGLSMRLVVMVHPGAGGEEGRVNVLSSVRLEMEAAAIEGWFGAAPPALGKKAESGGGSGNLWDCRF